MNSTATYADLAELVSTIKKPESSSSDLSRFPEDEEEMFDFEEEDEQLEEDAQQFSDGRDDGQWFVMVGGEGGCLPAVYIRKKNSGSRFLSLLPCFTT